MKKIAIIYSTNLLKKNHPEEEFFWLENESRKKRLFTDFVDFSKLVLNLSRDKIEYTYQDRSLSDWDFFIFRGLTMRTSTYDRELIPLLQYLEAKKKRTLNIDCYLNSYTDLKTQPYFFLSRFGINFPKTSHYLDNDLFLKEWTDFPILFKSIRGSRGRDIYKIKSIDEARIFLKKENIKNYMIQEFIENRGFDVRAMILGGVVYGLFKRTAPEKSFKTTAIGYKKKKIKLTNEIKKISLNVAKACKIEFTAVDIIEDLKGKKYVLDVNENPRFKSFEETMKINLAKKIINYLVK